ncbi:hypothetical protein GCM10010467_23220 [Actinocorallia glomerata]|uniref:Uncharacterized protein n=2 Tax=Actinomycetes TaxID=1760 RepID=A0ABP6LWI3_9MICC
MGLRRDPEPLQALRLYEVAVAGLGLARQSVIRDAEDVGDEVVHGVDGKQHSSALGDGPLSGRRPPP